MWRKQRGWGEDQRQSGKLFLCFCCKARVLAGLFYCGSQELQKGACRGDEQMREKRQRDVWRLDMRVLYFWSVCLSYPHISDTCQLLCCLHLCLHPYCQCDLLELLCFFFIYFFTRKKTIQYFSFHLSDYIISVLINMLQLWLLINMLFVAVSVLNQF